MIDLGIASVETRGSDGKFSDDQLHQIVPGLSND
ncbi:MAG TPA: benenodin family lasso peptide [Sphingomonas sp.]|nr:benenodin family lasso peptide [Sphingomonas sp.]